MTTVTPRLTAAELEPLLLEAFAGIDLPNSETAASRKRIGEVASSYGEITYGSVR